jgi:hypothetical protein
MKIKSLCESETIITLSKKNPPGPPRFPGTAAPALCPPGSGTALGAQSMRGTVGCNRTNQNQESIHDTISISECTIDEWLMYSVCMIGV